jgi:hypothetical protein
MCIMLPTTPFEDKLGTNYVPSDTEMSEINNILSTVDTMTAQLETQMEALKTKHAAVTSFAAAHRALLSPIRRVPADILTTIFLLCFESEIEPKMVACQPPLLFTCVCRRWRELVISTPSFWTNIQIEIPDYPSYYSYQSCFMSYTNEQEKELLDVEDEVGAAVVLELTRAMWQRRVERVAQLGALWLERGQESPLTVSITITVYQEPLSALASKTVGDLMSLICKHAFRWKHITLCSYMPLPAELLAVKASQVTQLYTLFIHHSNIQDLHPDGFANASSLRRLCVDTDTSAQFNSLPDAFAVQLSNLTELSLFAFFTCLAPSAALAILKRCPALVQCELKLGEDGPEFESPPHTEHSGLSRVVMPHLQRLFICETTDFRGIYHGLRPFFDALDVPNLHHLALVPPHNTRYHHLEGLSVSPLLQKWGDGIRSIEFGEGCICDLSHLIQALEMTPNVEELTLDLTKIRTGSSTPGDQAQELHDNNSTRQSQPIIRKLNAILRRFEVDEGLQPLCPSLRSVRFSTDHCSDIAAKALARLVSSRKTKVAAVALLQSVVVRFRHLIEIPDWTRGIGDSWNGPPARWRDSKLNALASVDGVIRVEWPNINNKLVARHGSTREALTSYVKDPLVSTWDSEFEWFRSYKS